MRTIAFWLSLVVIFTIPWEVVVEYPALGSASRLAGLAAVAFWLLTVGVTGRLRRPRVFHVVLAAFVWWNGLSVAWSGNADRTLGHLFTWVQLLVFAYLLWDLYLTPGAVATGLQVYLLGAYVLIGNMLSNFLTGQTFYFERFSAAGTNPDDLGAILALGIPIAWYLGAGRGPFRIPTWLKWFNFAYIPAALAGIALSGTRTALVAVLPGALFGLASLTRLRLSARIAIFIALIVATSQILPLIPAASLERLSTTGTELTGGDLNGRLEIWTQGLAAFVQHPLLGVGSNMYRSVNNVGKVAHNSFISVLVELGTVGFIIFLVILALVGWHAYRQAAWERGFWFTILATWAIAASTLTWEYRKPTWLFFGLLIANSAVAAPVQAAVSRAVTPDPLVTGLSGERRTA